MDFINPKCWEVCRKDGMKRTQMYYYLVYFNKEEKKLINVIHFGCTTTIKIISIINLMGIFLLFNRPATIVYLNL
jgi:hypothetical protein